MEVNRKIVGASVIGCSLVAGALLMTNLHDAVNTPTPTAALTVSTPDRNFITVNDQNNDGVEDWREEFVTEAAMVLPVATGTPFTMPETVTDRVGIELFQSMVQSKNLGPFASDQAALVSATAIDAQALVADELYRQTDIIVIQTTPESIRTYGNTMGQSLMNHNVIGAEDELVIIDRALRTDNPDELKKLSPLAEMYKHLRDDALNTPVPDEFAQEHLDVINVYNALYHTLSDLQLAFDDPMVALLRVKRYEDDAAGLAYALRNLYDVAKQYAHLFTPDDPAAVFTVFAQ